MSLTADQNIPERPKTPSEPWTFKRLFPFGNAVSAFSKTFVSPFEILVAYLVLVIGLAELIGRQVSLPMWILTALFAFCSLFERVGNKPTETPKTKKK